MKRYLLPLGVTVGALLLGAPDLAAQVAPSLAGSGQAPPPQGFDFMGLMESLGPSGLIGFMVYQLDRKDKASVEAAKAFAEGLASKDKTIQEMTQQHAERVEKFLEEAQDIRAGESERLHTMFDKILTFSMSFMSGATGANTAGNGVKA